MNNRPPEDEAYENYDFGPGVIVEAADGWERDSRSPEVTRIVYVRYDDDREDDPTHRVSFHVRIENGKVVEAWALEMEHGNEIGVAKTRLVKP